MDYNLYWDVYGILGEDMDFGGIGFEEWQEPGRDYHSLVADPMFVDPGNHDYRLNEQSPALTMGFEPIDVEKIGLYSEESWVQAPEAVSREPVFGFSPPLLREGPVSHPENLSKSDMWIIKYDPEKGRGTIPRDTEECALVWTIDGGRYPSTTPPGSQEVNGSCESPMKRGLDGRWYLIIPEQKLGAISLSFRDGVRGENWDDNRGERWWITSSDYVHSLLVEFDRVIANGSKYGADMSSFEGAASEAWEDYRSGEYGKAMNHLSGEVNRAWIRYTDRLLEFTASELESIRSTGVNLGREERLLYLAELMKGQGKFGVAEGYCKNVLSELLEIRDMIPEGALFLAFITLLVARRLIN